MARPIATSSLTLTHSSHFDFESDEYGALLARANASAFQRPEWLTAFYRHLVGKRGAEPVVIVGRSAETGELAMVVPLLRRDICNAVTTEYAFLEVTDYACPVVDKEVAIALQQTNRWPGLFIEAVGYTDILRIEPVRQEDVAIWRALIGAPAQELHYGAHAVELGRPFSQWRSGNLSHHRRHDLDAKRKHLSQKGALELRVVPADEVCQVLQSAREFRIGRFPGDPIQQSEVFDFYCEVASRGAVSGAARTYELRCDDHSVAINFGIVEGRRYCGLVLGCDYENYAEYSPGLLFFDLAMENWAASGGEVFDLTIGDEPYKNVFRAKRSPMYRFFSTIHSVAGHEWGND